MLAVVVTVALYTFTYIPVAYVFWRLDNGGFPIELKRFYAPLDWLANHSRPAARFFYWEFRMVDGLCEKAQGRTAQPTD